MTRNWIWLAFLTVLTALGSSGSADAQPEKDAPPKSPVTLEQLLEQIQKLQKSVDDQAKKLNETQAELFALRRTVDQLQKDAEAAKGLTRASNYPPTSHGRIRLVNQYPTDMTVVLSTGGVERRYLLPPGADRVLENQPAGTFFYQVVGVQPELLVRSLIPNETYTITVYPR